MFKSFYKLAARFGKTDRTHVGDLFVASVFGFCMALHIAPDGKKTHIADKGEMGHAFLLAEKLQENGLASWLLRASTEVLEHHLRKC